MFLRSHVAIRLVLLLLLVLVRATLFKKSLKDSVVSNRIRMTYVAIFLQSGF